MKKIKISRDQYISDIEPFKTTGIPSNSIWHKTITGCGITTFEIEYAEHHSIIIEPNVPVIKGKVREHNLKYHAKMVLGVYKGVNVNDIKTYLLSDVKYKKIITTPEGFSRKVVKAFANDLQTMLETYFLLYDECERIITDVRYRGEIATPLDIFFKFTNKALVSATTLPFLDERFDTFTKYVIEPNYDFSKPLNVITTNSVLGSLKTYLSEIDCKHICIFLNSTSGISAIIKMLEIESESVVFCADDSVIKLLEQGIRCGQSEFEEADMVKYNFFTSRYFSAIDIKVDFKPDVVMITDVLFAEHSILDPKTESIQIPGRFRNGVNSLTHITNFNSQLRSMSEEQALNYLQGAFECHEHFVACMAKATNEGSKDGFAKAIETSLVTSFYTDGAINKAMVANYVQEERVKGYYRIDDNLKEAYTSISGHYKTTYAEESYIVSDNDLYTLKNRQLGKEKLKEVANLLDKWTSTHDSYIFSPMELVNKITTKYPLIAEAYHLLGISGLNATGYSEPAIKKAIKDYRKQEEFDMIAVSLHESFRENAIYEESAVAGLIAKAYQELNISRKVNASSILHFFNGKRSTRRGQNVYTLTTRKDLRTGLDSFE